MPRLNQVDLLLQPKFIKKEQITQRTSTTATKRESFCLHF